MRRLAGLAVLISVLMVGCGGGSGETTSTSASQAASKAQYIEVGDVICSNHRSRREDLESQARELGTLTSPAQVHQVADLLREQARNLRAEVQELSDRRPPFQDAALDSFLSAVRAHARILDVWAGVYDDLDEQGIRRLQLQVGSIAATADERARKYGFHDCGR